MSHPVTRLPPRGRPSREILDEMHAARQHDVKWQQGRAFSLVFKADDQVTNLLMGAYTLFFAENALNPSAFPSLRKFETEVVAMTADLLGAAGRAAGKAAAQVTVPTLIVQGMNDEAVRTADTRQLLQRFPGPV